MTVEERLDVLTETVHLYYRPHQIDEAVANGKLLAAARDLALESFNRGAFLATGGELCEEGHQCAVCERVRAERAQIAALPAEVGEGSQG